MFIYVRRILVRVKQLMWSSTLLEPCLVPLWKWQYSRTPNFGFICAFCLNFRVRTCTCQYVITWTVLSIVACLTPGVWLSTIYIDDWPGGAKFLLEQLWLGDGGIFRLLWGPHSQKVEIYPTRNWRLLNLLNIKQTVQLSAVVLKSVVFLQLMKGSYV